MRFQDYLSLARLALSRDSGRALEEMRRVAANEEAAGKPGNARALREMIANTGGVAANPELPMIRLIDPAFSFDGLVLPKRQLEVADDIAREREMRDLLASHGLEPKSRILCHGSPGTGKTAYAHALARHLGLPLYAIAWSQVMEQYLGATSKLVDKMMDWICAADCVLLMDEVDIILRERDDRNEIGEIKRIVCNFLPRLENAGSRAVIVAATNHPRCLDIAVWRRFQERLEFPDADDAGRERMLALFLERHGLAPLEWPKGAEGMNFGDLAYALENALRRHLVRDEDFGKALEGRLAAEKGIAR